MKIFVLSKDTLLIYGLVVLVLIGMFTVGTMSEAVLTNTTVSKDLPVYRVKTDEMKIALTFDAAWGDEDTDELIAILNENQVKATFFMVGGFIERYPQSVKKFADEGHEIANHSDTHLHMSGIGEDNIVKELTSCEMKISDVTGKSTKLFRAPYGDYDTQLVKIARREGFQVIQWDVDSLDWKDIPSDEIISRVTQKVKNGSVILFHNGAKNTPEALRKLIPLLKEKGYTFVTVGDLIYKDKYSISSEGEQIKY